MNQTEVPSSINFQLMQDAKDWEAAAMDRPFRLDMFEKFAECIAVERVTHALELGSGPGFLAKLLCDRIPDLELTLLDFSEAMHELAQERLKDCEQSILYERRDFKDPNWLDGLAGYDCVFTNQAVHELRHKSLAKELHTQVRRILPEGGIYLVCDHFFGQGAMQNEQLYMTADEQIQCLKEAGFDAQVLLRKGSLQLLRAVVSIS